MLARAFSILVIAAFALTVISAARRGLDPKQDLFERTLAWLISCVAGASLVVTLVLQTAPAQ